LEPQPQELPQDRLVAFLVAFFTAFLVVFFTAAAAVFLAAFLTVFLTALAIFSSPEIEEQDLNNKIRPARLI
jgi:MFS superfamily sulfate permease-like transporter